MVTVLYEYMVVKMAEGFCWATDFQILKDQCKDLTVERKTGYFQYMFRFQDIHRLDNLIVETKYGPSLMYNLTNKMAILMKWPSRKFFVWDEDKVKQVFEKAIEISGRHKNNVNGELIDVSKTPDMFKNLGKELKEIQLYQY